MIRTTALLVCIGGLSLSSCAPPATDGGSASASAQPDDGAPYPMLEPRYDTRVEQAVRVRMRDGVRLSTDLYFPDGAPEPPPVILIRTPYDKVGTYGCSDLGDAQVWMAPAQPPSLAAMIPQASGSINGPADNIYRYFGTYNGGAFNLAAAAGWMVFAGSKVSSTARDNQFVVISPVSHCDSERISAPTVIGERDVGDARYDFWTLYVRWYDHWLKGEDNGVTDMPPVQYYLMGRNEWRAADEWPIAGTEFIPYYLTSGGAANSLNGDGVLTTIASTATLTPAATTTTRRSGSWPATRCTIRRSTRRMCCCRSCRRGPRTRGEQADAPVMTKGQQDV